MPSRQPPYPSPPSTAVSSHHHHHHLLPPLIASTTSVFSFFLFFLLCFRRLSKKRTTPSPSDSESKPPFRFSYSLLRRATSSFSTRLGHGGFGPVFSGVLPPPTKQPIAVKLMDSASLQGEREFHNELFFASRLQSQHVVSAVGFSSDAKRRRFLLVYELMQNGNLQDALLHRKCPELLDWKKRFSVIMDVAKGILYLHSCDPPVIHGDIKPSNILLDCNLSAKIGDFGLARLKSEPQLGIEVLGVEEDEKKRKNEEELESETHSVNTGEEGSSPEGFVGIPISPETIVAAPTSHLEGNFDKGSAQSEKDVVVGKIDNGKGMKSNSVKELWLQQDNEAASPVSENKKVKDYVMEWLGKDIINKDNNKPKSEWVVSSSSEKGKTEKKKMKRRLEWWASMDNNDDENNTKLALKKKDKRRPAREWWKEEYSEELAKKKKKKKKKQLRNGVNSDVDVDVDEYDDWWARDQKKAKKTRKHNSIGSNIDKWLDGFSHGSVASGEIPKSGGISISSTPSMRGTVCYVAPEYGYGEDVSEKCDVYSFGVLLLVIISGRRPLQVTASPLSEFHRANLLSWARHCARHGKLFDLVDQNIESLDKDQALLCITIALLCLLKSPSRRPSMKEVVAMLSGEMELPPQLPVEYSPSPPSRFPFKSRKKGR